MTYLRGSLIVPAQNESEFINTFLLRCFESIKTPLEILIVVDTEDDTTLSAINNDFNTDNLVVRKLINTYGNGPANAVKFGIDCAQTPVLIVTMADGSDDPGDIDNMVRLVERGCALVVASRYMPGGQQIGGPRVKRLLSRNASRALRLFARIRIHDATNSFRAFSSEFAHESEIKSKNGFELGLELTAKAIRSKQLIAEVPTIWIDRQIGNSKFKLIKWLPSYIKWFLYCFGPKNLNLKGG